MPEPGARIAWDSWRSSVDISRLDATALQVIPALGGRLTAWLDGDPAAGLFRGIVRRVWTDTQLRLSTFRSLVLQLEQAGCEPVMAGGSVAACLLNRLPDSVRPISDIRIVVRRALLPLAEQAIHAAGWRPSGPLPAGEGLDWATAVHFSREGTSLILQWRVLDVPSAQAAAIEAEYHEHRRRVDCGGVSVWVPGPEHALLAALCGRQDFDRDMVPWQVDAAVLPLDGVSWRRWHALAERFAPEAFLRLEEMRRCGLEVPATRFTLAAAHWRMVVRYRIWRDRGARFAVRLARAARRRLRNRRLW
jgi:hypothetical protein